ncbi:methyltransferase domain-containing protein [Asanoa sp. WMMD1127]|uniref:class I SAM-dependent methyltransferase n=1 Tax=Asanoa sp. WMMD1127 TaxID=3016107 RepID=UPI002417993E|nr:methyltransferase domain-containing protein [Asanoa sp. WMMD1127]MDG4821068.1 methyltransferase domain-containing protein [Asanoa sp. WMMD1127]
MTYALSAEAAEFYESTFVPALFAEWAERAVAGLAPGRSVLDVACGTGVVARAAADRGCTVVGLDANPAMLAVARRLRPDLSWRLGDACALPFAAGTFDVAVSQAGLMFFGDPVAALREMGRVAGRVVVQVPGRLAASAGYRALAEVVGRHAGPAASELLNGYFSVGEPAHLFRLFTRAGLLVDRFRSWTSATRLDSLDTFLAAELLPLADAVDHRTRRAIVDECRTALAGFVSPSGAVAAPIEVHLATARALPGVRGGGPVGMLSG